VSTVPATFAYAAAQPARATRAVAAWLFFCCAMIFAMVVIGGVTRLTESGLSITEWKPVSGAIPPLTAEAWQDAFAKYREIPEYRERNAGMTLAEFKNIYWWEFIHRLWGRLIGVVYAVPLLWFVLRGQVRGPLAWKLGGIFVLGGLQGVLGWYMVQSGLVERIDVSQYRLTAHLGLALLIYAATLWTALDLLRPGGGSTPFGRAALAFSALAFLTMLAGGFVAGLDAGMAYNTFPLMDGRLVPAGYLDETPWWLNLFENVAAVQFNHRLLGIATLAGAVALAIAGRNAAPRARALALATGFMAVLQVALGIATLLLVVPIPLAAAHQAGAVALLTFALATAHAARASAVRPARAAA
jgi:cytochrome c oxidase assembly protein subunit 15